MRLVIIGGGGRIGRHVVQQAIGPSGNTPDQVEILRTGMHRTIEAMRRHGVARIVTCLVQPSMSRVTADP